MLPSVRVRYDMVAVEGRLTAQEGTSSLEVKLKSWVELERAAP
jgi:acyl-CoA hydrolase